MVTRIVLLRPDKSPQPRPQDHTCRYTVTKDQQGRPVRFDAVTGEVTSLNGALVVSGPEA